MALYLTRTRLIIFSAAGAVVILLVLLFALGLGGKAVQPVNDVSLEVWGIFQDKVTLEKMASDYMRSHDNVQITYRSFGDAEYTDYEPSITKTLAEGDGPDIFFINNTWVPRHLGKLVPAPKDIMTADDIRKYFVDVVANDFVYTDPDTRTEAVYGAPLALDTLALFYNKEMFNSAGIAGPPATWNEFLEDVQRLTVRDGQENISRAGAAIGTANNILRSTDILSLLMIQNGSQMIDDARTRTLFKSMANYGGQTIRPGPAALAFYVQFANPSRPYYTWNRRMNFSVDAFYERKAAMMFGYSYNVETIRKKSPYLDFGVAPMPQISVAPGESTLNYANYWAPVVTKKTLPGEYKNLGCTGGSLRPPVAASPCWYAWDFIRSMLQPDTNKAYLKAAQVPAAQRALIEWQHSNAGQRLAVFADQGISAKNWYQPDSRLVEQYLAEAIDMVQLRNVTPETALDEAASKIDALFAKERN